MMWAELCPSYVPPPAPEPTVSKSWPLEPRNVTVSGHWVFKEVMAVK